jgi:hypothetical protein
MSGRQGVGRWAAVAAIVATVLAIPAAAGAGNPWVRVAAPSPGNLNSLESVSCTTATECTAVGQMFVLSTQRWRPLVVRTTDGTTWTRVPVPSPGPLDAELHGVDCVSATECVAVGLVLERTPPSEIPEPATLVMRTTDGASWARVPTPDPGDHGSSLSAVSCVTVDRCFAAGTAGERSLVLKTGNGQDWFRLATFQRGAGANTLRGIHCTTAKECTAVGSYFLPPSGGRARTLVLRTRDGVEWTAVDSPNPAPLTRSSTLLAVSCTSVDYCIAVGSLSRATGAVDRGFILRTVDGITWSRMSTPVADGVVTLLGVDCETPTTCTAAGTQSDDGGLSNISTALLRMTNGQNWSSPSPVSERPQRAARALDCPAATTCTAVGFIFSQVTMQARSLVLRET